MTLRNPMVVLFLEDREDEKGGIRSIIVVSNGGLHFKKEVTCCEEGFCPVVCSVFFAFLDGRSCVRSNGCDR